CPTFSCLCFHHTATTELYPLSLHDALPIYKLWRTRDPKGYHLEYGYSTMGYEIAGGLGIKMADPKREVYVLVGDGSYLMMAQEIDRKSTRLNSSHGSISYAVFCLKKKKRTT